VESETDSWAVFGDMTWSMREDLRLNLGLRFNREQQDFIQRYAIPGVGVGPLTVALDDSSRKVLPKVSLQYDISDAANLYVQWSKGFKSGGVNLPGGGGEGLGPVNGPYAPEEIDAYEIGLKTELIDSTVTWNTALFYYDYADLQTTTNLPPAITFVTNSTAEVYGLETEIWWQVTDNFKLNAAATALDSSFVDFNLYDNVTGITVDLDGSTVPHAPDYTLSLGADYSISLGGELLSSLILHGNVYRTDDVVLRQFGGPEDIQEGYTLVNLSATLLDVSEKTRINLFLNNATDKEYKQHVLNYGIGFMGNYGPPRTWGLRVSRDF
jgi:iron complex outermembrane receptor protein